MCVFSHVYALLLKCFWVVECFCVIRLLRTPFGRALTSSLIEPLVLRLPAATARTPAVKPAATASRVGGLFSSCKNPLPRLATRCRGGSRRRGRSERIWDLVFDRLAYKKPEAPMPCSSFGCRLTHRRSGGLPSDCSFGLRPRRTRLFCFTAR